MNLGRALSFCAKKTNQSMYLTAGGSGDDSVRALSVINYSYTMQWKCRRVGVRRQQRYLLLLSVLSVCFGTMAVRSLLPTNRRFTLELPMHCTKLSLFGQET